MLHALWKRNECKVITIAGAILLAARVLPTPHNGTLGNLPAICPYKSLTTIPCPGCGLTRSVVLCAHGDWAQAFHFHPLGVVFYFGLWTAVLGGLLALRFPLRPLSQRTILVAATTYAAALIILWVVRLTGIFPYPPHI